MIAAYNDLEEGLSPVNTGRAEWLPLPFLDAMRLIRGVVAEYRADRARRDAERAKGRHHG